MEYEFVCRKIGIRIRSLRREQNMTQAELCGDKITRNMLSFIENGKTMPSVATMCYLAERLSVDVSELFGSDVDVRKKNLLKMIDEQYAEGNYSLCLEYIKGLSEDGTADGTAINCHYRIGLEMFGSGSFTDAAEHFKAASVMAYPKREEYPIYGDLRMYSELISEYLKNGIESAVESAAGHAGCLSEFPRFAALYMLFERNGREAAEALLSVTRFGNNIYKLLAEGLIRLDEKRFDEAKAKFNQVLGYLPDPVISVIALDGIEKCGAETSDYETAYSASKKKKSIIDAIK